MVLSEDVRTESGRALERAIKARVPDANVIYVDPRIAAAMSDEILKAVDQAQSRDRGGLRGADRGQGHEGRERFDQFGCTQRRQRHAVAGGPGSCRAENRGSSPWEIRTWPRIFPRYRIIFVLFPTPAFRKSARSKLSLARSPFMATCRSAFPTSLNVAPASSGPAQIAEEGSQHAHTTAAQR